MPVFDELKELIVSELGVDEAIVTPEAKLVEDLGADSIDAVDLVMNCEDKFNVEIPDEALAEIKTVGDLVKYIENNKK